MPKDRYLQAVRGAAIASVVLIHCLPQCSISVAVRPFLNWAVAAFLFLSGLLTTEESLEGGGAQATRLPDANPLLYLECGICPDFAAPKSAWCRCVCSKRGGIATDVLHRRLPADDVVSSCTVLLAPEGTSLLLSRYSA